MIYRAVSVIELLTTLSIMAMALLLFSPVLFHWHDTLKLQQEINLLKSFFYQIQARSHYQQTDYEVFLHQNDTHWCAVAMAKTSFFSPPCNCLSHSACPSTAEHILYYPMVSSVRLYSRDLYPRPFLTVNAKGSLDSRCVRLILHQASQTLQTNSLGVINVAQPQKRTQCHALAQGI